MYLELCQFIKYIKNFEIIDRKKTIIKLLLHVFC